MPTTLTNDTFREIQNGQVKALEPQYIENIS